MAVKLEFLNIVAELRQGVWRSADPAIASILNGLMEFPEMQAHGGHPSPGRFFAEAIVRRFPKAARIVSSDR